jgi:hypothetical protein
MNKLNTGNIKTMATIKNTRRNTICSTLPANNILAPLLEEIKESELNLISGGDSNLLEPLQRISTPLLEKRDLDQVIMQVHGSDEWKQRWRKSQK